MKDLTIYQQEVNKEFDNFLKMFELKKESFLDDSYTLLRDFVLRGGKRLRAISCMKSYEALSGKRDERILLPALSLELFHASSLVHDDIMDEDDVRRNKASMHKMYQEWFVTKFRDGNYKGKIFSKNSVRFSTSAAIIQGNILFSLGLFCLTNCHFDSRLKNEVLNLCQSIYREVNEGQLLDLLNESVAESTEEDYIRMASLKTGKLFAFSMELGAIFAEASEKTRRLIHDFGLNIAIAFQIYDDIMDVSENMNKGNTLGSDIIKGKRTLLMIHALNNASEEQRGFLLSIFGKTDATREEILRVVDIFKHIGAFNNAMTLAEGFLRKGRECLEILKSDISSEGYAFLNNLSEYMTQRKV